MSLISDESVFNFFLCLLRRTNQFQATEEVSPVDVECEENTSQQSAEIDCILINNTNNNENSLPSVTTTAEEVEKESNNNTQDNNNCSMISTNEHISDTSSDSYSNYCSKRKLSGVDIVEQSSRCSKKLCFSQTIIVGNFQIQCPSVVPVACPIY